MNRRFFLLSSVSAAIVPVLPALPTEPLAEVVGPTLTLYRGTASPMATDFIGTLTFGSQHQVEYSKVIG